MTLHVSQAHLLKRRPETPLERRDALLVCLFLDQGFRCGEVHPLRVKRIDLEAGTVAVSGEKGNNTLMADTRRQRAGPGLLARTTCRSSLAPGTGGGKTRIPAKIGNNTPLFEHFPESPPCKSNKSGLERGVYVAMSYVCKDPSKHIRNFSSLEISGL
jgi:integrase